MGLEVGQQSAKKLRVLMRSASPIGTGKPINSGNHRQTTHVRITGEALSGGFYPCVPCCFQPFEDAWIEYSPGLAIDCNDANLEVNTRYESINYGPDHDSKSVFVVDVGCGIAPEIAGAGLVADVCDEDVSCCPKLNVLPGCGIIVNNTGVHVDVDAIVGDGLTVEEPVCSDTGDCCPRIAIANPVCRKLLEDVSVTATCNDDGTITINLTKTFSYFRGFGTFTDEPCEDSSD